MALWRDPLDDLVDDLQRVLPQVSSRQPPLPSFVDLQKAVQLVLQAEDDEEAIRRLDSDAWFQRIQAQLTALGVASRGKRDV